MEYWVTHCGLDSYLYLLLQRRFIEMTAYLFAVTLVFSLTSNLVNSVEDGSNLQSLVEDITLKNR